MKRLILLVALVMAMAVLAPAALADDEASEPDDSEIVEEKDPSEAQLWKAQMIADYVGYFADPEADLKFVADESQVAAVTAIRTGPPAVGWGVLFRLHAYEAAGMDLAEFQMDGDGYALGQIRKLFLEGDYLELPYANLGQLQKSYKEMPAKADKAQKPGKPDTIKPDKAPKKDKNDG